MQIVCPACGKTMLLRPGGTGTCDRCGCDLSSLRDIQAAAAGLLMLAKEALVAGEHHAALEYADRSWSMVRGGQSASVACLAASALGAGEALALWRARVARDGSSATPSRRG